MRQSGKVLLTYCPVQRPSAEQEPQESAERDQRSYPSKDMGGATGKLLSWKLTADAPRDTLTKYN